jgi:hypothetical protein
MLKERITLEVFLQNQKKELIARVSRNLRVPEALIIEEFDREIERAKNELIKKRKALKVFGVVSFKSSEEVRFVSKPDEIDLQLETVFRMKITKQGMKELLPNTSKITMERIWMRESEQK